MQPLCWVIRTSTVDCIQHTWTHHQKHNIFFWNACLNYHTQVHLYVHNNEWPCGPQTNRGHTEDNRLLQRTAQVIIHAPVQGRHLPPILSLGCLCEWNRIKPSEQQLRVRWKTPTFTHPTLFRNGFIHLWNGRAIVLSHYITCLLFSRGHHAIVKMEELMMKIKEVKKMKDEDN